MDASNEARRLCVDHRMNTETHRQAKRNTEAQEMRKCDTARALRNLLRRELEGWIKSLGVDTENLPPSLLRDLTVDMVRQLETT